MSTLAVMADEALLALKALFLVGLYAFVWVVVRSATRTAPTVSQESIVLGASEARRHREEATPVVRLRVLVSPALRAGEPLDVRGHLLIGRSAENGVVLEADTAVSARHATVESRPDGLWVTDVGSTNGTVVNGKRISAPQRLGRGDLVRIGETELVVEG